MNLPIDLAHEFRQVQERVSRKQASAWFHEQRERILQLAEYHPERGAERLAGLLAAAGRRVPRYRALRGRDDLVLDDFPLTRKADLQAHFIDFVSRDDTGRMEPGRFFLTRSSGSTGQPVVLLSTAETGGLALVVVRERLSAHLGLAEANGTVLNVGLLFDKTPLFEPVMLPRPHVKCNLGGFDPDAPGIVADYEAVVGRFPVDQITGSASRIISLARYCLERGIVLRPRGVIATYEQMPDSGRRFVEDVFDCPVTMLYATSETGYAAFECRERQMHFQDDFVLPEIVPAPGRDVADIVLTSLLSTAMPVIRYVTGDLAPAPTTCGCGLPGTVTKGLIGRARVSLLGAEGASYSPYALLAALAASGIPDFQLVQDEPGLVDLHTPGSSPSEARAVQDIDTRLGERFGPGEGFRLRHRIGAPFVLTAGGKRNPVVQRLDLPDGPERTRYIRA
ncbi:phenylacetate--CoA ligase family protein [Kitasatospora sp. NPDC088391]|uniref:phenylacetate--CoA ligase family protein n=1 Tax=Kitasatospora sp. NPDC088391 TaxID=3364074 RepID=UPI003812A030